MKTYLTACLIALCAAVACTTEVLVTREVEVTQEVEVTRLVEVTRQVEVTREVVVESIPRPHELCLDYPYVLELFEMQLEISDSILNSGNRAPPVFGSLEQDRATRDWLASALRTSGQNRFQICGLEPEPLGLVDRVSNRNSNDPFLAASVTWDMKSFEGTGACSLARRFIVLAINAPGDLIDLPVDVRDAITAAVEGYRDFCDEDFLK